MHSYTHLLSDDSDSLDDNMLKQLEVMIANEAIYTPKSDNCSSSCSIGSDNCISNPSLDVTIPPPSPISVLGTPAPFDHQPKKRFKSRRSRITPEIHREVCQWMYKVIDHYSFDRKIVAIGMNYFVRFVSSSLAIDGFDLSLELSTATSLYIAIKLFGGPKITRCDTQLLHNFAQMSNSRFDVKSIIEMEMKMLTTFSWHVHPSTPQDFVPYFVDVVTHGYNMNSRTTSALIDLSNYILELVAFNSEFSYINPSSLACAAMAIAKRGLKPQECSDESHGENKDFVFLQPLFEHGLLSLQVIKETIDLLNTYLVEISPMLDDTDLSIDSTGDLFKRSLAGN